MLHHQGIAKAFGLPTVQARELIDPAVTSSHSAHMGAWLPLMSIGERPIPKLEQ